MSNMGIFERKLLYNKWFFYPKIYIDQMLYGSWYNISCKSIILLDLKIYKCNGYNGNIKSQWMYLGIQTTCIVFWASCIVHLYRHEHYELGGSMAQWFVCSPSRLVHKRMWVWIPLRLLEKCLHNWHCCVSPQVPLPLPMNMTMMK